MTDDRFSFAVLRAAVLLCAAWLAAFATSAQEPAGAPAPAVKTASVKTFSDCADCPEMVVIPPGSFDMGSTIEERTREGVSPKFFDREGPVHHVTIAKSFAMGRTEVTRGLYAQFVAETHRPDPPGGCGAFNLATDSWHDRPPYSWRNTSFYQSDDHPAACLSWNDANDFAAWMARKTGKPYRLATEAEWEYAARAGTKTARYWGDAAEPGCKLANFMTAETVARLGNPKSWQDAIVCTSPRSFTQPVGSFPPNPWGLSDMIGNVYELIADCYHPNYNGAPTDGSAWNEPGCTEHMLRGGAFYSTTWLARSAHRGGPVGPDQHANAAGLRLVRDLP
jgi:formylglycine-generating enzyme required for sulfatase activity